IVRVGRLARRHPLIELHVDRVGDGRARREQRDGNDDERTQGKRFPAHNVLLMLRILIPAGIFVIAWPLAASAFKEGPYPNVTGGFGERSCRLCHLDNRVNAPGGSLTLAGVPEVFVPGQSYPITVTISREGLRRGGFEIAARFSAGKLKGRQAGTWKPQDARVQLIPGAVDKALTFVQHNLTGSRVSETGV